LSIHIALTHTTHYRYDRLVQLSAQVVRLRPAPHCRTRLMSYSLRVEPTQHFINWQQDPFANYLARLVFPDRTREFKVTVDLVAEMAVHNPFDFFLEPEAERLPLAYAPGLHHDLQPYLARADEAELGPAFQALLASEAAQFAPEVGAAEGPRTMDFLVALNQRLRREVDYLIRLEPGVQSPAQTLAMASGSCRDSAWLLVQLLRHLGLAARFVSGYLIQLRPDVKALDGPAGAEADFTDLHAWCEVFLPGAGWIGLDPTSGLLAGEGHIPLACTPDPTSAAPITGELDPCEVEFSHHMSASRLHESPRVTAPYTEGQWQQVLALGEQVEGRLQSQDVRLTMGGEPTFVAVGDRDAPEWNTDALGPTKRGLTLELTNRLMDRYGRGGFLHFGQGKWYPTEQLPRWALSICWRRDGQPCWSDPTLFADERQPQHHTTEQAHAFLLSLTARLGLPSEQVQPGYEDTWYYLWRERRLPVNVDPFDSRLDDELERLRLRRVFQQGLSQVVGYALPLTHAGDEPALAGNPWVTGSWFLRDERLYLMPGDSPMGYRLPLDSLPWSAPGDRQTIIERDPYAESGPLPSATTLRAQSRGEHDDSRPRASDAAPDRHDSAKGIVRTALCVEVRDPQRANGPKAESEHGGQSSVLYVFMPPLSTLEAYLELLAAVEATAADLGVQIVLEGYPPPRDARLRVLQVTPDPGVIEVNIHPAHDWAELVDHTEFLYEAAHQSRLSTEKFMLDGRHTGTGGGNHFVLGGDTPADSPFLRRPDLLASLLTYWINHPSLSYLFSGTFIGPTSQAPRIDEARHDQIFELEIALAELERRGQQQGHAPPWLIDRTLRNLLIDATGNTHRCEFSIDKLYSPDGPAGRLGLLELRAFEMPPHARMSLVQQLLLRSLVAWFWREPYRGRGATRLTRWGTSLHDRFMLPTFVEQDFADVLADLSQVGFGFDPQWFAPHQEFRFPLVGQVSPAGVELTLRSALEPWHVMGEEGAVGGNVRYVDSSLERLEVRVRGMNGNRHAVTVNGRTLPLHPTGRQGEFVAGVRYRAWQPASALHPTIGVHAPLTFDVVDNWNQRSMGGCRYHVSHPGGRHYDTFPVNAYEAESRRLARFFDIGHTPGRLQAAPPTWSADHPLTLDLRR